MRALPTGFSLEKHCDWIREKIGAEKYRIMPTIRQFALGVGHMRRKAMEVGEKADKPAMDMTPATRHVTVATRVAPSWLLKFSVAGLTAMM